MERSARPRRNLRALLAPATDNWLSRGYLAVVAASIGFFLYAVHLSPDPGFAAIWPVFATAPLGMAALLLAAPGLWPDWLGTLLFAAGAAAAGLVNATVLGMLVRGLRTPRTRPTAH
ncbi:putative membrane protein [Streptomyces davaonensis JCM 4913]|uniref:Putative membrane protein n=1 Tax=Streptomyces davaonensis (strain DSM 101723 / JCM 4913 / KCC S-0913 / 768) TaxID=1214101 RepID=K4R687_STRDJ|nr:hypothetical protein [Streptomyces davaonensis]CCK28637.1 putative membrane protein [Streptomyces davaonensis JCM 4913]